MIISITLNPSIDYILQVNSLALEETQRAENAFLYASGKGVNVSRMLARFGIPTSALGFIGGLNGDRFSRILEEEGVNTNFIPCQAESRLNVIITELKTYRQLRISAKGPEISDKEIAKLYERINSLPEEVELVTIGGSIPRNISKNIYKELIETIQLKGIKCILDTSNEPLILGIQAKPFLIKPNLYELNEIFEGKNISTINEIKIAASKIVRGGVKNVVVSLAKEGAIFINESKIIHAFAPKVDVKSKVGAGDSMVAGLIYGFHRKMLEEDILKYGIGFGTAAVLTKGTELAYKEDIEKILPRIEIKSIEVNKYI